MILDGKTLAEEIQQTLKGITQSYTHRAPCLAVVLIGDHAPSQIYVNRKTEACQLVGIHSIRRELSAHTSEEALIAEIETLNADESIDGILVQLPVPPHINPSKIIHCIDPKKDVDGFHPFNVGKLLIGETNGFLPCTPLGIKMLMQKYEIETTGQHILVIGRSNIVGKPMAAMLMQGMPGGNATVTIAHRYSVDLKKFCLLADIIIVAVGQPNFITADMVKEGVVIIDVGINKVNDVTRKSGYKIVGDVDFENIKSKASAITPVPGGIGPMTIAMLLHNTLIAYEKRFNLAPHQLF